MHVLGRTGRIDRLSGGACKSDDFVAVKDPLARFMAAGFIALRGHSGRASRSGAARRKSGR